MKQLLKHCISVIGLSIFIFLAFGSGKSKPNERKTIEQYINENKNKPILQNVEKIKEWEDLYNYKLDRFSNQSAWELSALNLFVEESKVTFKPPFYSNSVVAGDQLVAFLYLKPIPDYGILENYHLVFYLNSKKDKVERMEAVLYCSDEKTKEKSEHIITDQNFDISIYAIQEKIQKQQKLIDDIKLSEENKKDSENNNKRSKEKFEDECLSSWDGSCPAVVKYVKQNMNDPDSYEHVETGYKDMDSYVLIQMKFRGKNAFGSKVLQTIQAKVTWDCELIEVID